VPRIRGLSSWGCGWRSNLPKELQPELELARRVGLPELAVSERLNALAQAGLAQRDLERNAAVATPAGRGLVGLLEALGGALGERMSRGLPELLDS